MKYYYQPLALRVLGSYVEEPKVNLPSRFTKYTHLGRNCNFNGMEVVGRGTVRIGDNFHSGIECRIITQIHNYNSDVSIPYDRTYILKDVTIGDNVWFGDRVMILGGIEIGEGAIIQGGSVVVKDVPPFAIVGGHPAQHFSNRDKEKYLRLKSAGKFH